MALRRRAANEDGIAVIEVLVAIVLLTIGIIATFQTLDSTAHLTLTTQREQAAMTLAEQTMENIRSNKYSVIALSAAPSGSLGLDGNSTGDTSGNPSNPNYWVNTSGTAMTIPVNFNQETSGTLSGVSASGESFVTSATSTITPKSTSVSTDGYTATVYRYVTYVNDTCTYGGSDKCSSTTDAKRITVAVVLNSSTTTGVQKPVWLSSVIANPSAGSSS